MLRRKIGSSVAASGIVIMLFSISALPAQGAAPEHARLAPSPRPAIDPISRARNAALPSGHITGTIIDTRTGAPVPGASVNVGGATVQSDANGNYDHWLPVGIYTVTLELAEGQGVAAQNVMTVEVQSDVATIQHLSFSSPGAPAAAPAAAAATSQPSAEMATSMPATAATALPSTTPRRLPRTGVADSSAVWLWLMVGMSLLLLGGMIGLWPATFGRRRLALALQAQAANSSLLRTLLESPVSARATATYDDLLRSLLERDH